MKIAYDVSILEDSRFTGVEKVAFYLYSELWKVMPDDEHLLFCRKHPERLQDLPKNVKVKEVKGGRLWRYLQLPIALKRAKPDCFSLNA